ncbi:PREDICTED: zinc finger protein ZAT4 [Fragaria vesca subsp. vesca]|uniref:zinc finger protein ZAT4 n=1 Tax=Fragaria vesca subsp. vesca TaxID=101020 RepID=UPI0002C3505D|nr:PREDICTED: zinc finger protein ZAT4 [Fragaria vesca subsp. vesca]
MEKHQCKLCSRFFNNGRALGGHMKAHMAVLPLPPKTHQQLAPAESTHSASSFSSSSEDEQQKGSHQPEEEDQKGLAYGLRENPKKSFRLADPEFSFQVDAGSVVIQDRESETESRNPTRRRSKRNRKMSFTENLEMKKPKLTTSTVDSPPAEPEPLSSVSDTSPEEDVAMCLMMLSRDVWMGANYGEADQEQNGKEVVVAVKDEEFEQLEEIKLKKTRGKNRCDKCSKLFRSHQAMCVHRKICFQSEEEANNAASSASLFKCPFCSKIFGSGQALGGHKRSHLSGTSGYSKVVTKVKEVRESFIDLNMPAPQEEDDFSVVSDA